MSRALVGRKHNYRSASTRPEVAEKIRATWTPEKREAARQRGLVMTDSPEKRKRYGRPGMLNGNFQGGKREVPYGPGWTKKLKAEILERDNHCCQDCESQKNLHIHHIDFGKKNHSPSNLVTLCHSCHFARHGEHVRQLKRR